MEKEISSSIDYVLEETQKATNETFSDVKGVSNPKKFHAAEYSHF